MTEVIRLAPHDPVPDYGNHVLVLRRMGEDDPNAVITEIVLYGPDGGSLPAIGADGHVMTLDQAVHKAKAEAARRGAGRVYVVDRTAGRLEREVLRDHGDHSFPGDKLDDTDAEDGVTGSDIRDRPHDAGYLR
jgi:hypothetical protein